MNMVVSGDYELLQKDSREVSSALRAAFPQNANFKTGFNELPEPVVEPLSALINRYIKIKNERDTIVVATECSILVKDALLQQQRMSELSALYQMIGTIMRLLQDKAKAVINNLR